MRFRRPPTTRDEVDAWVQRVAAALPDGPVRDHWLAFPAGESLADELDARLRALEKIAAHVERGGAIDAWDDLLP